MNKYIGIDIGGTKCAVVMGEYDGKELNICSKTVFPTNADESPYIIIDKFYDIIAQYDGYNAVGISCGGPLDSQKGVVLCPPNLPKWIDVPICKILNEKLGVPVYLQNDANACALAEWKLGAGRGSKNMFFLTFGTGFGAGIVIDGKLYTGTNDMAGEIGHIRLTEDGPVGYGKAGSAEGYCSGGGIKNLAALFGINATAKELAHSAENGDKDAVKIYETSGKYLGRTAAVIMDIFNPDCIVIGSVFARSEKLLRPAMEAEIEKEALSYTRSCCKIVPALLGDSIGDCAAIMTAAYGFENQNK